MSDENLIIKVPLENFDLEHARGYTIPEYIREQVGRWGHKIAFPASKDSLPRCLAGSNPMLKHYDGRGENSIFIMIAGALISSFTESAENGRKYTYNQVLDNSRAFAAGLIKLGPELKLQRTDVVAVILPNVPEYAAILFGIWEAGLIVTPVNPNSIEHEIAVQVEASGAKVLVVSSKLLPTAQSIQRKNANVKKIITVGTESSETHENCVSFFDLLETETNDVCFFTESQLTTDNDVAILPFSSGTSGPPKGVMLTHFAVLANVFMFSSTPLAKNQNMPDKEITQDRLIAILPFFHMYGLTSTLHTSMLQGMHVMTIEAFTPATFVQALCDFKPTILYVVPSLMSFICNADRIGQSELECVKFIFTGAAPAGKALIHQLLDKARNAVLLEGYGLTETSPVLARCRYQKIGSVGQPLPEVAVKIVDVTTGTTLGQGERGEICCKTPCIMKGYLRNEQATRECIDEDGWFHTGDVGYYDEEGCIYVVDRIKELIKVKGFQVAPSELEDLIRSHEKVTDVCVIGIPDERAGELPRAFVVLKQGQTLTETEIKDFVKGKVSTYKYLEGGVEFIQEIPKAGSGKVLRRVLRDQYFSQKENKTKELE